MVKPKSSLKSILLVDDNQESLNLYSNLLKKKGKVHVTCTKYPSDAIKLANKYFYDIILIDVTINYLETQFGGLEVYKALMNRYGDSSLIVYSQYITDSLLRQYEYRFNFIEKSENPNKFVDELLKLMNTLRKRQSCFVAMPFSTSYNNVYKALRDAIVNCSYKCVRMDMEQFTQSITEKVFSEISNAKFVVFLANDKNPNAFYECGYAVALNKEIFTIIDSYDNLPFDIRDRNAIAYADNLETLKTSLITKLKKVTDVGR